MILEVDAAWRFIKDYKKLLLEIHDEGGGHATDNVIQELARARAKLMGQPTLLQEACARLAARSESIDPEVLQAVASLEVRGWIYLRDTKVHSIFLDAKTKRAFGVLGLTEPLRDIIGGSGVFLEAGLIRYRGRFVCDGVLSKRMWLGPSYKRSFNAAFAEMKAEGRFYVKCDANSVSHLSD